MLNILVISLDLLIGHDVNSLRIFSGGHCHELPLPVSAIAVSRQSLDLLLLTEAERRGAVVRRGVPAQWCVRGPIPLGSGDRQSVVSAKRLSIRVDIVGRVLIHNKTKLRNTIKNNC